MRPRPSPTRPPSPGRPVRRRPAAEAERSQCTRRRSWDSSTTSSRSRTSCRLCITLGGRHAHLLMTRERTTSSRSM
uniref:Uncharacterized protein n=1 Tax=Arundo donax TaxID=35708 RepID=A0A0A9DX03_ARUDO